MSGGKDSQTCLLLAIKQFGVENICGLFCDTQFEHPDTYLHVDKLRRMYGVQIETVSIGSVLGESVAFRRFPGGGARHCTENLKLNAGRLFYKSLAKAQGGFEVWLGMRSGESHERATRYSNKIADDLYEPHEVMPRKFPQYLGKMGVRFRLPILDWSTDEVLKYLNGDEHPHYALGFDRVGCFPCLAGGDAAKERAFKHDQFGASQYQAVMLVSKQIGVSIWKSKGGATRNADGLGCAMCSI